MRIVITNRGRDEIFSDQRRKRPYRSMLPPIRGSRKPTYKTEAGTQTLSLNNVKHIKLRLKKLEIPYKMEDKYIADNTSGTHARIISNISSTITDSSLPQYKTEFSLEELISQKKPKDESFLNNKKLNLSKEINIENSSLINYLTSPGNINMNYLSRISKYNDNQMNKLDKVCQRYYYNEELSNLMNNIIKQKLGWETRKDAENYRKRLVQMNNVLQKSKIVYNQLKKKEEEYKKQREEYLKDKLSSK